MTGGDLQRSRRRRPSGGVDRLPSGRWRARFYGPDARRVAKTFRTKADADAWIASQRVAVLEGRYVDPVAGRVSFGHFARSGLTVGMTFVQRLTSCMKDCSGAGLFRSSATSLSALIQPGAVRDRNGRLAGPDGPGRSTATKPYRLLRTIMRVAVADELIMRSPCTIKGAGIEHAQERPVATVAEVDALSDAIGERLRLAVLLAVWCGLRRGELLGLERRDIDLEGAVLLGREDAPKGSRTARWSWDLRRQTPVVAASAFPRIWFQQLPITSTGSPDVGEDAPALHWRERWAASSVHVAQRLGARSRRGRP